MGLLRMLANLAIDYLVKPIARYKVKQILKQNLKEDLLFAAIVLLGAFSIAFYLGSSTSNFATYYLAAVGIIATFRFGRMLHSFNKLYRHSSWLSRKIVQIGLKAVLTDKITLLMIAAYILLAVAIWLGRSVGTIWLLG